MAHAPHYAGDYQRRAKAVREAAYADPTTRCWRCGLTLSEHRRGDTWHAGHVVDGAIGGELRPEAASCNLRAAAAMTNAPKVSKGWRR